jgi:DNA-directed RNA polymerase specialized sigma24 family protein
MEMEANQIETADCEGYRLFQRAIMDRDEDAWAASVARYRPLLMAWASARSATLPTAERCDDIADQAFARAWRALSSAQCVNFPNLAALLGYLRSCVQATMIDFVRTEETQRRAIRRLNRDTAASAEQLVLEQIEREELWQIVVRLALTAQEYIVLVESFVLHLPPRVIQTRHADRFTDVWAIYQAKRNLLDRLRRNPDLRRLYLSENASAVGAAQADDRCVQYG